jgi:SAM-dependent methyltransferase
MNTYSEDKKKIIERYNKRLEKHGASIDALASGNRDRQFLRFKILTSLMDLNGKSILDLGCGFGDIITFFKENDIKTKDYLGIDINPKLIEAAKRKFPKNKFECKDILRDDPSSQKVDVVISSSTFNNRLNYINNYEFIRSILEKCYSIANLGVAINFMTDYVDFQDPDVFYYNPEKVFSISKEIAKRVTLRHDYHLYEFTVFLLKDVQDSRTQNEKSLK